MLPPSVITRTGPPPTHDNETIPKSSSADSLRLPLSRRRLHGHHHRDGGGSRGSGSGAAEAAAAEAAETPDAAVGEQPQGPAIASIRRWNRDQMPPFPSHAH